MVGSMRNTAKIIQKARRADLAAYEVKRSYTVLGGETVSYNRWRLGIVRSITRDGEIREIEDWTTGSSVQVKNKHGYRPSHIGPDVYAVPSDQMDLQAMRDGDVGNDYETLADLRDAIRGYRLS